MEAIHGPNFQRLLLVRLRGVNSNALRDDLRFQFSGDFHFHGFFLNCASVFQYRLCTIGRLDVMGGTFVAIFTRVDGGLIGGLYYHRISTRRDVHTYLGTQEWFRLIGDLLLRWDDGLYYTRLSYIYGLRFVCPPRLGRCMGPRPTYTDTWVST